MPVEKSQYQYHIFLGTVVRMKTQYKFALVALPLAVVTFLLIPVLWPNAAGAALPDASIMPFFLFIAAFECLAFGIGTAFAFFGWPIFRRFSSGNWLSTATFISIVWLLVSWWPHDNMHRVNGMENFPGLLRIEFMFHFTLIIAGFIVAAYFWRLISRSQS
jgi:hypothetical protein